MQSITHQQFPQFVFRDTQKMLWNPVLKRAYADLPEERVRLQVVEYLLNKNKFSSSRISFESPVNLPRDKSSSRTDVICYNKNFQPLLLIECKAPEIKLTEKASIQIARYNQKVSAPFLLITNGFEDYWFSSQGDKINTLDNIPYQFQPKGEISPDFDFWVNHGFAGSKSHPNTRNWINETCTQLFYSDDAARYNYFKFEGSPTEFYMPNYYRVFENENDIKLAISLTGTPFGATKLNGVLNENGINKILFSCSLNLLA